MAVIAARLPFVVAALGVKATSVSQRACNADCE
jgi:hypothetical protein